jgi:hypothetical protein
MLPIPQLAAATVANLAYLSDAISITSDGAPKLADRRVGCYDRLKNRLTSQLSRELLSRFEERRAAPDAQADLRQALKERLTADPVFRVELDDLMVEVSPWS